MPALKIFVAYRNDVDSSGIDNSLFYPVRGGAVFDNSGNKSHIQGDDTGDNISDKNFSYCELTVQYWAWKNIDLDYYGFCHYRRYFSFNQPDNQKPDKYANVIFDYFDENVLNQIVHDPDGIISKMAGCSLAMTTPFDVRKTGAFNVYDQYTMSPHLHSKDIDILLSVIHDISPEFDKAAKKYMKGYDLYPCNMFIMKKDLFFRYCTWLFPILRECERRIDTSDYNIDQLRVIGHLGERCLGIFYNHFNKNENIRAVFFQRLLIGNTDIQIKIYPQFNDQVTIVTASNDHYIPYLAVMVQSFLENSSVQSKYALYIMHTSVTEKNQREIRNLGKNYPNVFIEFYNMSFDIIPFRFKVSRFTEHISNETFYRTLIHKVFSNFDKVLYLDCDMVVKADVADLFKTDTGNNLVGACIDGDFIGNYCSMNDIRKYADETLKLHNPLQYFQGGVILVNIAQFRKEFNDHWLANLAMTADYRWGDQDVFNVSCQKRVFFLDPNWNVMVQHKSDRIATIKKSPFNIYTHYMNSRKIPKIIHYAGEQKPWDDPEMDFAEEFWNIAKRSPFYEILLNRMMKYPIPKSRQPINPKKTVKSVLNSIISPFFPPETRRRRFLKKVYYGFLNS